MSKLFKDKKKEYYSLRKFKGVGLASALVGLSFMSQGVLAEETSVVSPISSSDSVVVVSSQADDKEKIEGDVKPTIEVVSPMITVTPLKETVENKDNLKETAGANKPEEVDVVKPSAESVEEGDKHFITSVLFSESKPVLEGAVETSELKEKELVEKLDSSYPKTEAVSTDSAQSTRSRRGKRSTTESPSSTIDLPLSYGSATLPMTFPSVTETTKIDYTTSSNPSLESDNSDKKVYNNQIESIEKVSTANKDRHRFRIMLKDGQAIPPGGKLVLATIGGGSPISKELVIGSETVGTVTEYRPSIDGSKSFKDSLKSSTTVKEYVDTFEKMGANNLPVTSLVLEFNSNFSKYNVNRLVEFEINSNTTNLVDYSLVRKRGLSGSSNAVVDSSGTSHTLEKRFTSYLLNPYDSKGIALDTTKSYISVNDAPKGTPVSNELTIGMDWGYATKPNYLDTVYTPATGSFKVSNRESSADSIIARKGSLLTYRLPDDSLFATSKYSVGDIVSVTYLDNVLNEERVNSNRFTDTDNYVNVEKPAADSSQNRKGFAKFKLVERTDKGYKWELLEDISMKNSTFYMNTESLTPVEFRSDWVSKFGETNLKRFLEGTTRSASSYLGKEQLKAYVTWTSNGVTKDVSTDGLINKNTNLILGENTTGTLKVVHKSDTGEILKAESVVADNKPWYTPVTIDPQNFDGYQFKRSSEVLSTIVGSGTRTIELIYAKPSERVSKEPIPVTYVVDNTKDGNYRNEVVGTPKITTTRTEYIYSADTRTSTSKETVTVQEGTPTVVTLGTKPTTEVTYQDFTTRYVADPTRTAGEKFTETAGVRGTTTVETTYSVNKETGVVTPTKGQPVVVAPRDAVVKVGTKPTVTEKPINFTTLYEADETKGKGVRTDKVAGVQGKVITTTTYTLDESTGNVTANNPTERREEPTNKVITVGTAPTVTTKRIAYGVEYQRDDTVSATSPSTRVQDGVDGEKRTTTTYSVNPKTGVVTDNSPVETTVAPKPQIEKLGTKPEDIITTQDFKRTFVADENKDLGYRQVETQGIAGKTVVHRTYTLPDNVPPREDTSGIGINYEFAVAIPHDSEPEVTAPVTEVTRVGVKPKVETQTIAVTTKYIADESLEFGKVVATEKGSEGRVVTTTTYTMNPTDGTTTANKPTVDTTPMVQRVVKVGVKKKVVETPIEFTTRYERDETAEAGKKTPSVSGIAGTIITTTTYTMNPTTGVVTENPSTTVREEPTTAVVKVGTKEKVEVTPIPSPVRYESDTSMEKGSPNKETKGVDGSSTVTTTYSVDSKTGFVTETVGSPIVVKATETVVKVGAKSKVVVTPIPVEVEEVVDPDLFEGDEKVTSNGKAGSTTTTTEYVVNPKTGEITEKDPVVSTVPMEKKVVHKGTKKRKASVTISYVLKETGAALGSATVLENQQVGSPYNTSVKVFEPKVEVSELPDRTITKTTTYVLEKEPENKSGIVTEKGVSVVYTYRAMVREEVVMKESKLTVNFVLEGSGEKLHESLVKEGVRVGDPYVTEPLALQDKVEKRVERNKEVITTTRYELVETPSNAKGAISVGGTAVDYFYRAVVKVDEYPTIPNDAPKTDLPEYTNPIGTPGIPEVHDKPTYLGHVGTPGDSEVHELPEFNGGVVPNDAPKVELPAYDNGVVPNYAPIHEVPEYTEPLGFVPSDAPQFELPEFKGGVVPNDAPILEKPEYKIPTVSEEPKQPAVPVVEIPQSQPQPQAPQQQFVAKELPNTGISDSDKLVALSGVGLLGLLGFSFKKRKED